MKTTLRITRRFTSLAADLSDLIAAFHVRCLGRAVQRAEKEADTAASDAAAAYSASQAADAVAERAEDIAFAVQQAAIAEARSLGFAVI